MFDVQERGRRIVIMLDRAPVNAINDAWLEQFHSILDRIEKRPDISLIHIRTDHKVFCAGMDVAHIRSLAERPDGSDVMVKDVRNFQRAFARIEAMPQVVLAEIGGPALGGGLELALACDLRIASRRAKIGLPEARLGLIPGAGGTQRLTRLCGRGVASRLILTGEIIDGEMAESLGIVQWSIEPEQLASHAQALSERIGELSIAAVQAAKRLIAAAGSSTRDGFAEELEADRRLFGSSDTQSRIADFLQKAK